MRATAAEYSDRAQRRLWAARVDQKYRENS